MSKPAVSIQGVSKAYRIGVKEQIPRTVFGAAKAMMGAPFRNFNRLRRLNTFRGGDDEEDLVWALKNVSFDVAEGEVVGIIGNNGAGKSTLLKILSRITEPTRGQVVLRGRVSSLLEVGTGFHPEMTGRENVYMNGTILGMTKREIDRKFDEIVDFSGIEKFLDTPVKRYSSGMSVRLAFAVAAHLEPEILIIDEVLAVGDAEFQTKCLGKMREVATQGRTVLFVSHNMAAVEALCTKAVLLARGTVKEQGDVARMVEEYLSRASTSSPDIDLSAHPGRPAGCRPIFQRLRILDDADELLSMVRIGGNATFELTLRSEVAFQGALVFLDVEGPRGDRLLTFANHVQHGAALRLYGTRSIRIHWHNCRLAPGRYSLRPRLKCLGNEIDSIQDGLSFEVSATDVYGTGTLPNAKHGCTIPEVTWEC